MTLKNIVVHKIATAEFHGRLSRTSSSITGVLRMPGIIAHSTHIQVFEVLFIVTQIQYLTSRRRFFVRRIAGTRFVGTRDGINTWQRGIQFDVLVHNMVKLLVIAFHRGIQYTMNLLCGFLIVHVPAIATIVRQFVGILRVQRDIVHVVTRFAKLHDE